MGVHLNPYVESERSDSPDQSPFFQAMPERRARVNPIVRDAISAFILAHSMRYWPALVKSERGLTGDAREAVVGARRHARHALTTLDTLRRALGETIQGSYLLACCEAMEAVGDAPTLVQLASMAGGEPLDVEG